MEFSLLADSLASHSFARIDLRGNDCIDQIGLFKKTKTCNI